MQTLRHNSTQARGFSLIELLIVMTLVALAAVVVPVSLSGGQDRTELRSTTRALVSELRAVRAQAMTQQTPMSLTLDLSEQSYQGMSGEAGYWPESVDLQVTVPDAFIEGSRVAVVFFPDGSSAGGEILVTSGALVQGIDIRWLTGRVSLLDSNGGEHAIP